MNSGLVKSRNNKVEIKQYQALALVLLYIFMAGIDLFLSNTYL
jgi:hypothetical protein